MLHVFAMWATTSFLLRALRGDHVDHAHASLLLWQTNRIQDI
jgi:hypothetical protein